MTGIFSILLHILFPFLAAYQVGYVEFIFARMLVGVAKKKALNKILNRYNIFCANHKTACYGNEKYPFCSKFCTFLYITVITKEITRILILYHYGVFQINENLLNVCNNKIGVTVEILKVVPIFI